MSFLYPLLLAAMAAISLPILLHLIRRRVRHRVTFSSLRFVRTTAPRLRNRRRLENLVLLVLRCLAVCILVLAFARPFLVRPAAQEPSRPGLRTVVLVDTSASMRRAGIWDQALAEARSVLDAAGPSDRVCVMAFDRETRTLVGFDAWAAMAPGERASACAGELARLSPGWAATNLGQALVYAAEAIEDDDTDREQQAGATQQIVLVSDLQRGSRLEALAAFEWPSEIAVVLRPIRCRDTTNAAMHQVSGSDSAAPGTRDEPPLIRVTNSPDAKAEQFSLAWAGQDQASGKAVQVYVPAGTSVVVRAPARADVTGADRLVLTGDDQDFDNTLYVAPHTQSQVQILYLGSDDPNDPKGQLYYLRQALGAAGPGPGARGEPNSATVAAPEPCHVTWRSETQDLSAADLDAVSCVIVGDAVKPPALATIRRALDSGATLLVSMRSAEAAVTVAGLAGFSGLECTEADSRGASGRGYAMLGRMEFGHPLLAPFADPRFSDFTRVHFWRHRRMSVGDFPKARVLAWFDGNDPALLEVPAGRGTLVVLCAGWGPEDSDLALSSKFVPLLYSVLEYGGAMAAQPLQYSVGDPLPVTGRVKGSAPASVRRPDHTVTRLEAGQEVFTHTGLPGLYSIESTEGAARSFAVNLDAQESRTEPLPIEDIEGLGVSLKPMQRPDQDVRHAMEGQGSAAETEQQQKLWRWLLVAAGVVLLAETWMAGRPSSTFPEGQAGEPVVAEGDHT